MEQESDTNNFPWKIHEVDSQLRSRLKSLFTGYLGDHDSFIRIGPKGYLYPDKYNLVASKIYNMPIKPTDVFVASFPRSGTTVTQELVWLVANNLDYTRAAAEPLCCRYPNLDASLLCKADRYNIEGYDLVLPEYYKDNKEQFYLVKDPLRQIQSTPDPRFIKLHLPLSLMPPKTLDTAKMVYVARDPRDVAVSLYHYSRSQKLYSFVDNFKVFWNLFINDLVIRGPYFAHVKEAWEQRNHPHMLFIFYEELQKDLPAVIHRVATFFNIEYSEQQITSLCVHLSVENLRKNQSVAMDNILKLYGEFVSGEQSITVRKGKSGEWRNYFDEEMQQQAEQWMADNLRDTDLRFPQIN